MRLSDRQKEIIGQTATRHFGKEVKVFLFGSRSKPALKGGDIDLLLEGLSPDQMTVRKKVAFIVELKKVLGDQKIDVVYRNSENQNSDFIRIIEKSKIRLC